MAITSRAAREIEFRIASGTGSIGPGAYDIDVDAKKRVKPASYAPPLATAESPIVVLRAVGAVVAEHPDVRLLLQKQPETLLRTMGARRGGARSRGKPSSASFLSSEDRGLLTWKQSALPAPGQYGAPEPMRPTTSAAAEAAFRWSGDRFKDAMKKSACAQDFYVKHDAWVRKHETSTSPLSDTVLASGLRGLDSKGKPRDLHATAERISQIRQLTAPSIPTTKQALGYEDTASGRLRRRRPDTSRIIREVSVYTLERERQAPAASAWARSKEPRFVDEKPRRSNQRAKRGVDTDISALEAEQSRNDVRSPPPGAYNVDECTGLAALVKRKNSPRKLRPLASRAPVISSNPILLAAKRKQKRRLQRIRAQLKQSGVGPGHYTLPDTWVHQDEFLKAARSRVAFGRTVEDSEKRTAEEVQIEFDMIESTDEAPPLKIQYTCPTGVEKERKSKAPFQSTQPRFPPMSEELLTAPTSTSYDVMTAEAALRKQGVVEAAHFGSSAPRFAHWKKNFLANGALLRARAVKSPAAANQLRLRRSLERQQRQKPPHLPVDRSHLRAERAKESVPTWSMFEPQGKIPKLSAAEKEDAVYIVRPHSDDMVESVFVDSPSGHVKQSRRVGEHDDGMVRVRQRRQGPEARKNKPSATFLSTTTRFEPLDTDVPPVGAYNVSEAIDAIQRHGTRTTNPVEAPSWRQLHHKELPSKVTSDNKRSAGHTHTPQRQLVSLTRDQIGELDFAQQVKQTSRSSVDEPGPGQYDTSPAFESLRSNSAVGLRSKGERFEPPVPHDAGPPVGSYDVDAAYPLVKRSFNVTYSGSQPNRQGASLALSTGRRRRKRSARKKTIATTKQNSRAGVRSIGNRRCQLETAHSTI